MLFYAWVCCVSYCHFWKAILKRILGRIIFCVLIGTFVFLSVLGRVEAVPDTMMMSLYVENEALGTPLDDTITEIKVCICMMEIS